MMPWLRHGKGGKGKGGRQCGKSNKPPDGRALCFKFNKECGCADPSCRFAHVCWRCFGKHSFRLRFAGLCGTGPPLYCISGGARKPFSDGCSLCSPGRWPPSAWQDACEKVKLSFHQRLATKLHHFVGTKLNVRDLANWLLVLSGSLPSVTNCWRKAGASSGKSFAQQDASYL